MVVQRPETTPFLRESLGLYIDRRYFVGKVTLENVITAAAKSWTNLNNWPSTA